MTLAILRTVAVSLLVSAVVTGLAGWPVDTRALAVFAIIALMMAMWQVTDLK